MTDDTEIDADELRAELDQIKAAMGLEECYSGATSIWLLFGLAVPVAAALSQYVVLERLPFWYHSAIWLGTLAVAVGVFALLSDHSLGRTRPGDGKPRLWVQFLLVYLASIPLQTIASTYAGDLSYVADSSLSLSIILVTLGVAYGIFGTSLRAYYVRKRDRYVFYVGTGWMIGLALAISESTALAEWAYAVFGGVYFVYAIATYLFLEWGGGASA
jgi:hypothetical protein